MQLANTLTYIWKPGGKLPITVNSSPSMYTDPISTDGADQIGLFAITTPSSGTNGSIYIRIAWAGIRPTSSGQTANAAPPTVFIEECVEVPAIPDSTNKTQRFALYVKEYGPLLTTPATPATIWVPTAAHYFKIGCYSDVALSSDAAITIYVERAWTGSPTQQGH